MDGFFLKQGQDWGLGVTKSPGGIDNWDRLESVGYPLCACSKVLAEYQVRMKFESTHLKMITRVKIKTKKSNWLAVLLDYRDDLDFVASSYSDYAYSASIGCWSFAASTPTFSRVFLIVNWYPVSLMSGERERERDCETRVSPHQQDTMKWHPPTPLDLVTFNPEFNVQTIRPVSVYEAKRHINFQNRQEIILEINIHPLINRLW